MTEWRPIREFPEYSVSDDGQVVSEQYKRYLTLCINQNGNINVGLTQNLKQHKRSVALLVALEFLEPHSNTSFNTPIHLDGDNTNNRVSNLMWRPKWFATKYALQFRNDRRGYQVPIEDMETGEQFPTSWLAATKYGLIDREILYAIQNNTFVWPTYQMFRVL